MNVLYRERWPVPALLRPRATRKSFRLFIYDALCGGAGAFVGWGAGPRSDRLRRHSAQGVKAMLLGLAAALALGLLDALWHFSLRRIVAVGLRVPDGRARRQHGRPARRPGGARPSTISELSAGFLVFGWTLTGRLDRRLARLMF